MRQNTEQVNNFEIEGGHTLHGSISTNTSKNGSVGLLCASLLNRGITVLHGIARIEEVYRIIEIMESIGATVSWIGTNSVEINPPKTFDVKKLNRESAEKTRSIIMFIGPLSHFLPSFYIPHAEGCNLGN